MSGNELSGLTGSHIRLKHKLHSSFSAKPSCAMTEETMGVLLVVLFESVFTSICDAAVVGSVELIFECNQ